jgi:uncharacterized protein (DUF488 family)
MVSFIGTSNHVQDYSIAMQRPLKLPAKKARERLESKVLWNDSRNAECADFFTFGYEGRATDDIISALKDAGVETVIDIRFTPLSMYRPELSKANFQRRIEREGLSYIHCPELGVPKDIRAKAMQHGTRKPIWDWYEEAVVQRYFGYNLHWFLNLAHPAAMMCVEHDPEECHRHLIFNALERNGLRGYDL